MTQKILDKKMGNFSKFLGDIRPRKSGVTLASDTDLSDSDNESVCEMDGETFDEPIREDVLKSESKVYGNMNSLDSELFSDSDDGGDDINDSDRDNYEHVDNKAITANYAEEVAEESPLGDLLAFLKCSGFTRSKGSEDTNVVDFQRRRCYCIPYGSTSQFFKLLNECRNKGMFTQMYERQGGDGGLMVDLDISTDEELTPDKREKIALKVVKNVNKIIHVLTDHDPDKPYKVAITYKPSPVKKEGKYRDGFHAIFNGINLTKYARRLILDHLKKVKLFGEWVDVASAYVPVFFIGSSSKPDTPAYILKNEYIIKNGKLKTYKSENPCEEYSVNLSASDDWTELKEEYKKNTLDFENCEPTDFHVSDEYTKCMLDLLSYERHDDFSKWFDVLCSLNALDSGEDLARYFSKKSQKYDDAGFDKYWENSLKRTSNKLSIRSLYYWAKRDNTEGYYNLISKRRQYESPDEPETDINPETGKPYVFTDINDVIKKLDTYVIVDSSGKKTKRTVILTSSSRKTLNNCMRSSIVYIENCGNGYYMTLNKIDRGGNYYKNNYIYVRISRKDIRASLSDKLLPGQYDADCNVKDMGKLLSHIHTHVIRKLYCSTFVPYGPTEKYEHDKNILNTFPGYELAGDEPVDMDFNKTLWKDHLFKVICGSAESSWDFLRCWIADLIQNPRNKCGVALYMHSKQGAGKGTLCDFLAKLIGESYCVTYNTLDSMTNNFNSISEDKLLSIAEEVKPAQSRNHYNQIKDMITNLWHCVEPKGYDKYKAKTYARYIFNTNNRNSIKIEHCDRRFFMPDVDNSMAQNREYFDELIKLMDDRKFLKCAFDFFANTEINVNLRIPPNTRFRSEQKIQCLANPFEFIIYLFNDYEDLASYMNKGEVIIQYNDLRQLYENFCRNNGYIAKKKVNMESDLKEIGIQKSRLRNKPKWDGVKWACRFSKDKIQAEIRKYVHDDTFTFL